MSTQPTNAESRLVIANLQSQSALIPFEIRIRSDWSFAMEQGDLFFAGKNEVQKTLKKITQRLQSHNIPHAVAGGMSLIRFGYLRNTDDVALLVTRDGLREIHEKLEGLGYKNLFTGSKGLRDAETGVKIDFLITGDYPGDGKPKEISFPNPVDVAEEFQGMRFINLPTLITLKLASGLTGADRAKDIGDVEQLVKICNLEESFSKQLPNSMQEPYRMLWQRVLGKTNRFVRLWQPGADDSGLLTLLQNAGVVIDTTKQFADGKLYLVTNDATLAKQNDFHPEEEFFFDQ
jgi:hypothetical protein